MHVRATPAGAPAARTATTLARAPGVIARGQPFRDPSEERASLAPRFDHDFARLRAVASTAEGPAGSAPPGTAAPRGRRACVRQEQIPTNRSGILNAGGVVGEQFDMNIDWDDGGDCDPRCGEYRQYIRGHLIINGLRQTLGLWGGATLEESVYHEDGSEQNPRARYGHRDEPATLNEEFLPDRARGNRYRGHDFPRVRIGSDTDVLFQFKGQSYDRCNDRFGPIHEWKVAYAGPINQRGPTPLPRTTEPAPAPSPAPRRPEPEPAPPPRRR